MTPDHVRGKLSSDAGATSSSISSPIAPLLMPTLSNAPSLTLSPVSITSDNPNHRPFAGGLLRSAADRGSADGATSALPQSPTPNRDTRPQPRRPRKGRGDGRRARGRNP